MQLENTYVVKGFTANHICDTKKLTDMVQTKKVFRAFPPDWDDVSVAIFNID